jgi:hypothetical protein
MRGTRGSQPVADPRLSRIAFMGRWEFTYVDLRVKYPRETIDPTKQAHERAIAAAIDRVKDTIAQLGDEGWEPVGEIVFAFDRGGPPSVSQLMFKRPHAD